MNVQAHVSGQISGQVPNQLSQQNGSTLPPNQMQDLAAGAGGGAGSAPLPSMFGMDAELGRKRIFMQDNIFAIILQRQARPVSEPQKQKYKDFAKRLEEGLFKAAQTQLDTATKLFLEEDYMNLSTLESRLSALLNQLSQQNGSTLPPNQMQDIAAGAGGGAGSAPLPSMFGMDAELDRKRIFMQDNIFAIILQRQARPVSEPQKQKYKDFTKRLEEGLFKAAQTQLDTATKLFLEEDYMNLSTLDSRLSALLKRNQQQAQFVNSSSSIGTMIPTPGMSHSGSSNLMVSSGNTMMIASRAFDVVASTTVNTGSLLPTNGTFSGSDGSLTTGYQQSPASGCAENGKPNDSNTWI